MRKRNDTAPAFGSVSFSSCLDLLGVSSDAVPWCTVLTLSHAHTYEKKTSPKKHLDAPQVNMLAREYCDLVKPKIKNKPIILSHHMMPGLKQGQEKMSKSDPESAIFMEDSEQEVRTKVKKAFCPEKQVEENPCLQYAQYLVFPKLGEMSVKRTEEVSAF